MSAEILRRAAKEIRVDHRRSRELTHLVNRECETWLAVADWLDRAARDVQSTIEDARAYGQQVRDLEPDFGPALAVARAYLGESA